MKKFKVLITIWGMALLLTGCVGATIDINIKNDDTGKMIFMVGYEEEYLKTLEKQEDSEGIDFNSNTELTIPFKDVESEKITFNKNDYTYVGEKVEIDFNSLDELNERLYEIFNSDEDTENNMETITFNRDGNEVNVFQKGNENNYEQSKMFLNYVDYTISFKIDGKIISNNADKYDEKTNTLEWNIKTILKEGIQFKYKTSNNLEVKPTYIIIASILIVASGIGFVLYLKRKHD